MTAPLSMLMRSTPVSSKIPPVPNATVLLLLAPFALRRRNRGIDMGFWHLR